jgi:hypothetical protein
MVVALAGDVSYALSAWSSRAPAALGDLGAAPPTVLSANENRAVTGAGLLGAVGALRYERPLRDDTFRALPILGRFDLWVEVRVAAGSESGRWEPPRSFTGRLQRLDRLGPSHRGLRDAIEQSTHAALPDRVWVLVDGEVPAADRWVVLLMAVFLGCAAWNLVAIARIVRKVST